MVIFRLPLKGGQKQGCELGLVTSIWHGMKAPHLTSNETAIDALSAFRAVCLQPVDVDEVEMLGIDWGCVFLGEVSAKLGYFLCLCFFLNIVTIYYYILLVYYFIVIMIQGRPRLEGRMM